MSGNRRVTLGPLNPSAVNSRNMSAGRLSIGPGGDMGLMKSSASRMSLGVPMMPMQQGNNSGVKRMSLSGTQQRRSSVGPRTSSLSTTTRVADPRNIGEKSFMSSSIRALVEFLTERCYDQPISPKILTKPTNKDYYMIVLFLFKQIDSNYALNGKLEDEIVSMFRFLGYPFPVAKSHISAVGSPHAWPNMLATIMWLIELLRYDEAVLKANELEEGYYSNASLLAGDSNLLGGAQGGADDVMAEERAFYRYLSRAYALFIAGRDEQYAALEQQFVASYENANTLVRDQIESLETKNAALHGEIEEVKRRAALLPELDTKKRDLQRELAALEKAVRDKEHEAQIMTEKIAQKEREQLEMKGKVSATNKEIAVLKDKIATQEISPEDVVNMVNERARLEEACASASLHRQGVQRRVVELEMLLRDKVQALEDTVRAYHSIAEDMKMIPVTARNSRGENLVIELDIRARRRENLMKTQVRATIVPVLQDLKRELAESTLQLRGELLVEREALDDLEAQRGSLREAIDNAELRVKRAEAQYRREKESLEQTVERQQAEWDEAEGRLLQLRDTAAEEARIHAASRRLAEVSAQRRQRLQAHTMHKQQLLEAIMEVVGLCASHREQVQQETARLKEAYGARLASFLTQMSRTQTLLPAAQKPRMSIVPSTHAFQSSQPAPNVIMHRRRVAAPQQHEVEEETVDEEVGEEEDEEVSRDPRAQLHETFEIVAQDQQQHRHAQVYPPQPPSAHTRTSRSIV